MSYATDNVRAKLFAMPSVVASSDLEIGTFMRGKTR